MVTITEKEFRQLSEYIKCNYGIHLRGEKQALVIGRLHNLLQKMGFTSFSQYYEYIMADKKGEAARTLVDKITTNHTYFMREADHFNYFIDL